LVAQDFHPLAGDALEDHFVPGVVATEGAAPADLGVVTCAADLAMLAAPRLRALTKLRGETRVDCSAQRGILQRAPPAVTRLICDQRKRGKQPVWFGDASGKYFDDLERTTGFRTDHHMSA